MRRADPAGYQTISSALSSGSGTGRLVSQYQIQSARFDPDGPTPAGWSTGIIGPRLTYSDGGRRAGRMIYIQIPTALGSPDGQRRQAGRPLVIIGHGT
ncbi:hypothetical protein KCP73_21745 [Salmonella enterica subsp. enterica]|nr:hypothetical protein KCP73_21745 [Salmonella enterica subsp. enterica]